MRQTEPQRHHVLVVDDDPSITLFLAEILKDRYDVSIATDGETAIDFCRKRVPDLVLLDVMMPGLDGYETCRMLKANANTADVPIIFMTARDRVEDEIKGLDAGAMDFLAKPLHPTVVLARVRIHVALKLQADQLRELAATDMLTGVANRRWFDEALESEWRRCRRNQAPIALIMIDIDHFKRYNDAYGHVDGDACLTQVANALENGLRRPGDLLARYGGEEFVCLLPETALDAATRRADELGRAVEQLNIVHAYSSAGAVVTVSRGVSATVPAAETEASDLVRAADAMLYAAKYGGRNQTMSGPLGLPGEQAATQKTTVEIKRELPRFLANCRKSISAMHDALPKRDFEQLSTIGHRLKGAGGGYGFPAITEFGARIEKAAEAGDEAAIAVCLDEYAAYLASIEVGFV